MSKKSNLIQLVLLVLFGGTLFAQIDAPDNGKCITCHEGIEQISDVPEMAELSCIECHKGNDKAVEMDKAHLGMWANPTDFRVVDETCGNCHDDHVDNSKKSMHATMAGMISGTRYTWGAQDSKNSKYGTYDVKDSDGTLAKKEDGGIESLKQLPAYDPTKPITQLNHPVDDYLRDQCLRCHLWSSGHERDGDYRGSGCAACHVVYSDDGLYEGNDKAIDKKQKDRPIIHKITSKIPSQQCIHCHNRGGRTGVSYIGTMESDGYGSPWGDEAGKKGGKKLHGKYYNHLTADIHYQKGMECIDCHTMNDLHGDGNMHNKKEEAVEIECQDCHGTADKVSDLRTSKGTKFNHMRKEDGKIILKTKIGGKDLIVPQVKEIIHSGSDLAKTSMGIASHMDNLECYACHATWAPQCYGCHAQQDLTKGSSGWITTGAPNDVSKSGTKKNRGKETNKWRETRSYLRWESPTLGINSEGKVAPFIPGCQVIFTQIGPDGKVQVDNKIYTTADGTSGFAHNQIQPHTISKESRTCEDCHSNPKAVGLGSGVYNSRANGLDIDFEMDKIVDAEGKQLQATSHEGARPFNKEEQQRILRVNACASCHAYTDKEIWKDITKSLEKVKNNAEHNKLLQKVLLKGTGVKK